MHGDGGGERAQGRVHHKPWRGGSPAGGGGPGSGPIGVKQHLRQFLPTPLAGRRKINDSDRKGVGDGYWYFWEDVGKDSIGKVQQWNGNAGAVVRSWAFYRRYGRELEKMSEHAVLNSNYLRHKIMNPDKDDSIK